MVYLDFVTKEQAMALKRFGFPQEYSVFGGVCCHYNEKGNIAYHSEIGLYDDVVCACPTLQHVAKWLLVEKNVFIKVNMTSDGFSSCLKDTITLDAISDNLGYCSNEVEALSRAVDRFIDIQKEGETMKMLEEDAINAFHAINDSEYNCSLAEAQYSEEAYNRVKKEYEIAQNAFVQGAMYRHNIENSKNR